jgi:pentose-5-phosphate-3-epimerase
MLSEHYLKITVAVDGRTHLDTAPLAVAAGATVLVGVEHIQ